SADSATRAAALLLHISPLLRSVAAAILLHRAGRVPRPLEVPNPLFRDGSPGPQKTSRFATRVVRHSTKGNQRKPQNMANSNSGTTLGFEADLWRAADVLRGSMDSAEYKHVVLGLI